MEITGNTLKDVELRFNYYDDNWSDPVKQTFMNAKKIIRYAHDNIYDINDTRVAILGLAPDDRRENLIVSMKNQGVIDKAIFSVYLRNESVYDEADVYRNSTIKFGGYDEFAYDNNEPL